MQFNFFLSLILLFSVATWAAFEPPKFIRPIQDETHRLSPEVVQKGSEALERLYRDTETQLAVLVVDSLQGDVIENASIKTVDAWKLGKAKTDKGVLLLIALRERKLRIEVGQGLEGQLTDLQSKRIIDYKIVPFMKKGDIDAAVLSGITSIVEAAEPQYSATFLQNLQEQIQWNPNASGDMGNVSPGFIFGMNPGLIILIVIVLIILSMGGGGSFRGPRGRGGFGGFGGGSGGGFGGWSGGGGGGFSGGGASGGW